MSVRTHPYSVLSELLKYPAPGFRELVANCDTRLQDYPNVVTTLRPFVEHVQASSLKELEELYIRTFDIQAICHLDVGYVLFGEDYKRGRFLVHMKQEHAEAKTDCGAELPDHLPYVLTLLSVMKDSERATELVQHIVLPALEKMLQSFKEKGNVYGCVLNAIFQVLQQDHCGREILPTFKQEEATL